MAIPINWWAIIVTAIISFARGNLWYGPLFGRAWLKLSMNMTMEEAKANMTPEIKKKMVRSMILVVVGAIITNFILLHNITFGSTYLNISGVAAGLQAGFWNWLGFVAPVTLGAVLWENKPWKYWFILAGYYLVVLLINGVILAMWM